MQLGGAELHQFVYAVYAPHRFIERHLIICGKAAYVPAGQLPLLRVVAKLFVIFGYGVRWVYAAKLIVRVIRLVIVVQLICAYCVAVQRVLIIRRFFQQPLRYLICVRKPPKLHQHKAYSAQLVRSFRIRAAERVRRGVRVRPVPHGAVYHGFVAKRLRVVRVGIEHCVRFAKRPLVILFAKMQKAQIVPRIVQPRVQLQRPFKRLPRRGEVFPLQRLSAFLRRIQRHVLLQHWRKLAKVPGPVFRVVNRVQQIVRIVNIFPLRLCLKVAFQHFLRAVRFVKRSQIAPKAEYGLRLNILARKQRQQHPV